MEFVDLSYLSPETNLPGHCLALTTIRVLAIKITDEMTLVSHTQV